MSNITISIPAASAPFLIRAIEAYSEMLVNKVKNGLDAPNWTLSTTEDKTIAILQQDKALRTRITTKKAPYGYKADGTPKKRPGRPARKAVRK